MIVAGGAYHERCVVPDWDEWYGSGGRAARALATAGIPVEFYTACDADARIYWEALAEADRFGIHVQAIDQSVYFGYWTPIHTPLIVPDRVANKIEICVDSDVVLRFGMMEGEVVTRARTAIYDPQSNQSPHQFIENGSSAERLAMVCNEAEAKAITATSSIEEAVKALAATCDVLFVKRGPGGVLVHSGGLSSTVPAYRTRRLFKIGSGDVFSAAIARFWGIEQIDPEAAANLASRAVALYVDTRRLCLDADELRSIPYEQAPPFNEKRVYVAAPFFDLGQRRMLEDVVEHLTKLRHSPNSPLHVVGTGEAQYTATRDLELLKSSDAVFSFLDGTDVGSVFEVGYARAIGKPVVAYTQRTRPEDLTMILGSNCDVYDDYTAALYAVGWT